MPDSTAAGAPALMIGERPPDELADRANPRGLFVPAGFVLKSVVALPDEFPELTAQCGQFGIRDLEQPARLRYRRGTIKRDEQVGQAEKRRSIHRGDHVGVIEMPQQGGDVAVLGFPGDLTGRTRDLRHAPPPQQFHKPHTSCPTTRPAGAVPLWPSNPLDFPNGLLGERNLILVEDGRGETVAQTYQRPCMLAAEPSGKVERVA